MSLEHSWVLRRNHLGRSLCRRSMTFTVDARADTRRWGNQREWRSPP